MTAVFAFADIGEPIFGGWDLIIIPVTGTFWGSLIAISTAFLGIPVTVVVTFGISWTVRLVLHRPAVPAGRAPTNGTWGDRFEG